MPLKPIPPELEEDDMPYIGADLPQHIAEGVCEGEAAPKDPSNVQCFSPCYQALFTSHSSHCVTISLFVM